METYPTFTAPSNSLPIGNAWGQDGPEPCPVHDVVSDIINELRATTDTAREAELLDQGLRILRGRVK